MDSDLQTLSDAELLSNFISETTAKQLIAEYQSLYGAVIHTSLTDVAKLKGFGRCKLNKLICIREILHRIQTQKEKSITKITSPKEVAEYLQEMEDLQQEEFRILMLNTKNKIIGQRTISKGTINCTLVSPREIFAPAIKMMASNLILAHNHPSGESNPSSEDIRVTKVIAKAGNIINIKVLDHVIIGKNTYCSFKEQDLLDSE